MTARYAIYFSPADASDLARFGTAVLGRDANSYKNRQCLARTNATGTSGTNADRFQPIKPFADEVLWQTYTEKPAHYGFHATIKAPFELAPDCTAAELLAELSSFCGARHTIALTDLAPANLGAFTALTMPGQPDELVELASDVVRHFEPFRQELSPADIKRRQVETLTASQIDNLEQFGYPHIFADFQFHMTLSGPLPTHDTQFVPWVQSVYRQLVPQTPLLDRLCVFRQVDRSTPFVRIAEFRLITD